MACALQDLVERHETSLRPGPAVGGRFDCYRNFPVSAEASYLKVSIHRCVLYGDNLYCIQITGSQVSCWAHEHAIGSTVFNCRSD